MKQNNKHKIALYVRVSVENYKKLWDRVNSEKQKGNKSYSLSKLINEMIEKEIK